MRRLLTPLIAAAIVLAPLNAASAAPSAHASVKTRAAIVRLDHRIDDARTNLRGWRAWLARWNDQLDQAERAVWSASALVTVVPRQVELVGALRPGVLGGLSAVAQAAAQAQAHLDKVRGEPEATAALQQVFAWQDYLDQLRTARHDLKLFGATVGSTTIPAGPVTYDVWGRMLLARLGAPACGDNRLAMVAWQTAESTDATFNPLATTHVGGVSALNTSGVQNYATLGDGLTATVDTLTSGAPGYTGIMDALQICAPASVTVDAIRASVWCANCANGAYVADLLAEVRANFDSFGGRLIAVAAPGIKG
jgi:hypothetical protein